MVPSTLLEALCRDADPFARLARHHQALRRLEDIAESYLERGAFDDAIGTVDAAAHFAELNHPGVLASPRLEALVRRISRDHLPALSGPMPAAPQAAGTKERVLVVVTETYESGGHTRVLWRWIARDPTRSYSIATTAQRGVMPQGVRAAVAASGGQIFDVPAEAPPLKRAAVLRALAADADLIVLIDHPFDPIPALAFAGLHSRPPIVMFNHGDHIFWMGRDIVDVLMNIRREGAELTRRRGYPEARTIATSFPISGPDGHGRVAQEAVDPRARAHARREVLAALGWPEDTVLLLTVGTHHKWEGPEGHRLLDLVEPVLDRAPNARLLAAGALDRGRWSELRARLAGRVHAAGVVPHGVGALLTAADIFLDSRPLGGMAAPAEAAAHGLPVLSGQATELETSFLAVDPAYGANCIVGNDAYRELLERLIEQPGLRAELGERGREQVARADAAWEGDVDRTFALARELGPIRDAEFEELPAPGDRDVLIDWATSFRGRSLEALESGVWLRELIAGNPSLRPLYGPLEHTTFRQIARYPAAFAAPSADVKALREAVSQLRALSQLGLAERFMIALTPGDADQAIPALEAALAEGADFELELTLDPEPRRVQPANALVIA